MKAQSALIAFGVLLFGLIAGTSLTTCIQVARGSQSDLRQRVHTVLIAQPVARHDIDEPARKTDQLRIVASSIVLATEAVKWPGGPRELAALLLTTGQHESYWELAVGEGNCRPGMCDRDRNGRARAVSYWQLHANPWTLPQERWERLAGLGLEPTTLAAIEAARALKRARGMCGADVRKVLSAYAGLGCRRMLPDIEKRAATYARTLGRL